MPHHRFIDHQLPAIGLPCFCPFFKKLWKRVRARQSSLRVSGSSYSQSHFYVQNFQGNSPRTVAIPPPALLSKSLHTYSPQTPSPISSSKSTCHSPFPPTMPTTRAASKKQEEEQKKKDQPPPPKPKKKPPPNTGKVWYCCICANLQQNAIRPWRGAQYSNRCHCSHALCDRCIAPSSEN